MSGFWHNFFNPVYLFGGFGSLAILSLVFKENKLYRLFEHIFLGLQLGYDLFFTWTTVLKPLWWDPMVKQGQWAWIITLPVGLMVYTIYFQRLSWLSRVLFGFFFGFAAGTVMQQFCQRFMPQVTGSFKPLVPPAMPGDPHATLHQFSFVFNNLLFMVILICVLVYFFFAFEQKNRAVQTTARLGRLFLMFSFGAIFGSTIMTRMALLIDRMYYVFHDWLHLTS